MLASRIKNSLHSWQVKLVLLLIGCLCTAGLALLRQDRRMVEQEAQVRAHELAETLARHCRLLLDSTLGSFVAAAEDARRDAAQQAEGQPNRPLTDQQWYLARQRAQGNAGPATNSWPALVSAALPRVQCSVRGSELFAPPDFAELPQPPEWLLAVPRQWLMKLEQAQGAAARRDNDLAAELFREVLKSNVRPLQARAELELALMSVESAAERAQSLRALASQFAGLTTESGVPLSDLALLRAIELAAEGTDFQQLLFDTASMAGRHPSFLTERLLSALEERTKAGSAAVRERVAAIVTLWRMDNRARGLLRVWQADGEPDVLWLSEQGGPIFLFSYQWPIEVTNSLASDEPAPASAAINGRQWLVQLVPQSIVTAALRIGASEIASQWPAYFDANLELAGQSFALNPLNPAEARQPASRRVLAAQSDAISALPNSYPFVVTVGLVDPALLLRHHQRRAWLFSTLIVVCAGVASGGAWLLQRNLDAQLELSRAKTNFVSSVSHELRAPIAAVRLMAESLEAGKIQQPQKQAEYFRFIVQECRRLSGLIENVLDFSRIEQGRKEYQFEPTDLLALVKQTVELMQTYAAEKGLTLRSDLTRLPPSNSSLELWLDGRAIQQALVNLIDNAIRHSPKSGTVTVGLEISASEPTSNERPSALDPRPSATLWIEDQGEGIPAEEHEKIFERFYRRGSELRRETPGVGIGLSLVKHIVEAHNGRVLVRSAVGQGSRFTIRLPMLAPGAKSEIRNLKSE